MGSDYVQGDYDFHHADYDHHYDHHHHRDDYSQQSFHSHGDHFEMDEDVFHGFRDSLVVPQDSNIPMIKEEDGKEGGNLSRSPSSIMLFDEQQQQQAAM